MGKILSQEEIDLLLGSANELRKEQAAEGPSINAVTYDFRRPNRMSKEQVRSLQLLHDRFGRNVSSSLSAYLRAITEVSIVSVEQLSYAEFLMSVPDPTAFYAITMAPLDGVGALEINPAIAFTMIDRMLGGTGRGIHMTRALTEIEQNVVDAIIKLILENLADSWRSIQEVRFKISGRETRPQMLQVAAPNEAVLLLVFEVKICDSRGMLNFCVPASTMESIGDVFAQNWFRSRREATVTQRQHLVESLGRVRMPVTAMLDLSLSARDLLDLRPGDILSLGRPAAHPVRVRVGSSVKFTGHLVRHGVHSAVAMASGAGAPAPQTQGA